MGIVEWLMQLQAVAALRLQAGDSSVKPKLDAGDRAKRANEAAGLPYLGEDYGT